VKSSIECGPALPQAGFAHAAQRHLRLVVHRLVVAVRDGVLVDQRPDDRAGPLRVAGEDRLGLAAQPLHELVGDRPGLTGPVLPNASGAITARHASTWAPFQRLKLATTPSGRRTGRLLGR
jgi:hypothetical protein